MARRSPHVRVLKDVVEEHAEEASFLWTQRDAAIGSSRYSLRDLAELDERVEAHLDGLRVAGNVGWRLSRAAVDEGGPGELFVAAVLAFESGAASRVHDVLAVAAAQPDHARALMAALGWLDPDAASVHIRPLLAAADPTLMRVGIVAAVLHRKNPGGALSGAFASPAPLLKARALRVAGELGLVDSHVTLRANLKAKDPTVRFWAAWSNALLNGHKDAVAYLQKVAEDGGPFAERAAQMAMRRLVPNEAKVWLKRLVKELGQKRIAIIAAGAFADPEVIPFLIDQMKAPKLARVAGESFSLITGANIAYDDLDGEKPEGFEAGPTENPDDENVALDRDENLPWPDPALIQKWWNPRQGQFAKGTRYLLGQPITPESLRAALKNGYQRQRGAAALELAILEPGRPLFEVRAPGFRQRTLLG